MLKLKLRLMRENIILYVIMIGMAFVMTSVFSQSMGGEYKPSVGFVQNDATSALTLSLEGYHMTPVTYQEGVEMVKSRDLIALIYQVEGNEEIHLMRLNESMETLSLKLELQQAMAVENAIDGLSDYSHSLEIEGLDDDIGMRSDFFDLWTNKKPINVNVSYTGVSQFENFDTTLHYTVGMTLFFLTYSIMFTIGDFLEDKRQRTLDRMMVSPVKTHRILLANIIPGMLIGLFQMAFMIISGQYVFGIQWGSSIGMVLVVSLAYVFAIAALCTLVISIVKNISQLGVVSPIILTGMAMIGGCMWPIEIVTSKIMLFLSYLTPHRWALQSLEILVTSGQLTGQVYQSIVVLFGMGIVYFALGNGFIYLKTFKTKA